MSGLKDRYIVNTYVVRREDVVEHVARVQAVRDVVRVRLLAPLRLPEEDHQETRRVRAALKQFLHYFEYYRSISLQFFSKLE